MNRASGFTLIEALVALLVLSIGLLGVAGMQLMALQSSHSSYQRSLASLIAVDVQEKFWLVSADDAIRGDCSEIIPSGIVGNINGFWEKSGGGYRNQETLPSILIDVSTPQECVFIVDISWTDDRFLANASNFTYTFRLPGE